MQNIGYLFEIRDANNNITKAGLLYDKSSVLPIDDNDVYMVIKDTLGNVISESRLQLNKGVFTAPAPVITNINNNGIVVYCNAYRFNHTKLVARNMNTGASEQYEIRNKIVVLQNISDGQYEFYTIDDTGNQSLKLVCDITIDTVDVAATRLKQFMNLTHTHELILQNACQTAIKTNSALYDALIDLYENNDFQNKLECAELIKTCERVINNTLRMLNGPRCNITSEPQVSLNINTDKFGNLLCDCVYVYEFNSGTAALKEKITITENTIYFLHLASQKKYRFDFYNNDTLVLSLYSYSFDDTTNSLLINASETSSTEADMGLEIVPAELLDIDKDLRDVGIVAAKKIAGGRTFTAPHLEIGNLGIAVTIDDTFAKALTLFKDPVYICLAEQDLFAQNKPMFKMKLDDATTIIKKKDAFLFDDIRYCLWIQNSAGVILTMPIVIGDSSEELLLRLKKRKLAEAIKRISPIIETRYSTVYKDIREYMSYLYEIGEIEDIELHKAILQHINSNKYVFEFGGLAQILIKDFIINNSYQPNYFTDSVKYYKGAGKIVFPPAENTIIQLDYLNINEDKVVTRYCTSEQNSAIEVFLYDADYCYAYAINTVTCKKSGYVFISRIKHAPLLDAWGIEVEAVA